MKKDNILSRIYISRHTLIRILFVLGGLSAIGLLAFGTNLFFDAFLLFTAIGVIIQSSIKAPVDDPKKSLKLKGYKARIKEYLGLHNIVEHRETNKLPKWIGGAIFPSLPIFTLTNTKWKERGKEAYLHENIHLYFIMNRGFILMVTLIAFSLATILMIFHFNSWVNLGIIMGFDVCAFVYFEKITYDKTYEIAPLFGFQAKKWDNIIMIRYCVIYTIQFVLFIGVIVFLRFFVQYLWRLFV